MDLYPQGLTWLSTAYKHVARSLQSPALHNRLQVGSGLALAVGLIASAAFISGVLGVPQARFSDILYQPIRSSGQVALVTIDDKSLRELGPLPWPRTRYADLMNSLTQVQPRGIAFLPMLTEPGPDDAALIQALGEGPQVVQPIIAVDATRYSARSNELLQYQAALLPALNLRTPTTVFAHTTVLPDGDGIVRRIPLAIIVSGQTYLAVGMTLLDSKDHQPLTMHLDSGYANWGARRLPVDNEGSLLLGFADPAARLDLSAADLLSGRSNTALLHDKYVLVGVTASSAPERYATPLRLGGRRTSAVEIQADLMETLLQGNVPIVQDRLTAITMILLVALLAGATLPHVRFLSAAGMTILYFVAYLAYAFQKFNDGIIVEPLYPTLALIGTFAATMVYRYFAQDRERDLVERLFRRHAAVDTLQTVLEQHDRGVLRLSGTRRLATVLYIDLRDFAPQNESLAAEAAVKLLGNLMADITNVIFRHGGLLVRQQGSAVLASWNIPVEQPDHARAAACAAAEIRTLVQERNVELEKELAIGIGMGIASGTVLAGRIGRPDLAEYTLVGDAIQVAAHLAQRRDGTIFIDAATRERLSEDEFLLQQVSKMRLRRRTDPLEVWEIVQPLELEPIPEQEIINETF